MNRFNSSLVSVVILFVLASVGFASDPLSEKRAAEQKAMDTAMADYGRGDKNKTTWDGLPVLHKLAKDGNFIAAEKAAWLLFNYGETEEHASSAIKAYDVALALAKTDEEKKRIKGNQELAALLLLARVTNRKK